MISPLSFPFPFSPPITFQLIKKQERNLYDKAEERQAEGDSLRVDLAVLHHISFLGFLSLPFSCFHNSSFLFSLFREEKGKGEIRERGSIKKMPCFVFPYPLFISLPLLSLLFPLKMQSCLFLLLLLSPSSSKTKNTRKT